FDLTVMARETPSGMRVVMQYAADIFDLATIERLSSNWKRLLAGVVANPESCVLDLPLLSEEERRQLLVEWNQTQQPYPSERSIAELFEEQVARDPEKMAIVDGSSEVSYGELNRRRNQLAKYLPEWGGRPGAIVRMC